MGTVVVVVVVVVAVVAVVCDWGSWSSVVDEVGTRGFALSDDMSRLFILWARGCCDVMIDENVKVWVVLCCLTDFGGL